MRICILALSAIADDPRVRRQGDSFHRAGWNVVGVGLAGSRSGETSWPILTRDAHPPAPEISAASMTEAAPDAVEPVPSPLPRQGLRAWLVRRFRNARKFFRASETDWQ